MCLTSGTQSPYRDGDTKGKIGEWCWDELVVSMGTGVCCRGFDVFWLVVEVVDKVEDDVV